MFKAIQQTPPLRLPLRNNCRFHDLRQTRANLLIATGVHPKAIQARLGHASITTTLNTYRHLMPSAFQGVGSRLEALLPGKLKANKNDAVDPTLQTPRQSWWAVEDLNL